MSHTVQRKKQILTRIRRINGQVTALEKAVLSEAECSSILQQIAAIRGAANGLMMQVLEEHIRVHLGDEAVTPEHRNDELDQVIAVLRSYIK